MRIFYRKEQVAKTDSYSPSAGKPELVMKEWAKLFPQVPVETFDPVREIDFYRAHDPRYVRGVLTGAIRNGFNTRSKEVIKSLPYTTGSMVSAALYALDTGDTGVSPTSGFHHAGEKYGGGFCTFNGLVVAASMALDAGAGAVAIIDGDNHYGDGTQDIIDRRSLHERIHHYPAGYVVGRDRENYLKKMAQDLASMKVDLVLYQAGADAHFDDPLGGFLTTAQMIQRDRLVFSILAARGIPVAWNLAGGYQKPIELVLELHNNTMREALAAQPLIRV